MEKNVDGRIRSRRRRTRRRKRKSYQRRILFSIAMATLLVFLGEKVWSASENMRQETRPEPETAQDIEKGRGALRGLNSLNAVLIDAETGDILEGYNSGKRIYPASLTKIMTAVLAVEHTEDMEEVITLPSGFFQKLYGENASMAGFEPKERVRLKDLLYGILLPSGAECCLAFAERIAGSEKEFAALMNEKAAELGMNDTKFCNSMGLHERGHYSTAEDIAVLLHYAIKNDRFREAFTSKSYCTFPSEIHPEGFTFTSTMFQHLNGMEITDGAILGGKTGYTPEAGLCLASLAEVSGKEYILVTAGAGGNHETEPYHVMDAINVYNRL